MKRKYAILALGVFVLAIQVYLMIEGHVLGNVINALLFCLLILSLVNFLRKYKPFHQFPEDIQK